jgi:broad specificity phosphatase PhoE
MRNVSWLGVIRHGESTGNVAVERAQADLAETIDIDERDADVPLSSTGESQARALREWIVSSSTIPPDAVVVSPFRRARQTADLALEGVDLTPTVDERLRDRDFGVLDLLTKTGIEARMPEESRRRARHGKFYYRPPGGESWADVLLRLRSLLRDIDEDHAEKRVLLFAHDATVSMIRYLLEGMDEQTLLESARETPIANCSISSWRREGRTWVPELFNDVSHIEQADAAEPTAEEDVDAQIK